MNTRYPEVSVLVPMDASRGVVFKKHEPYVTRARPQLILVRARRGRTAMRCIGDRSRGCMDRQITRERARRRWPKTKRSCKRNPIKILTSSSKGTIPPLPMPV